MAGLIPQEIIDKVLDANDIVEIISGYIPLKRAGRNFKALCPFHHEKTSSFVVSPDRQIYHCFGCGVGGNVVNFLMRYERMEFPEALETLANKVGITIPKDISKDASQGISQKLFAINELACNFYNNILVNSRDASSVRSYLEKRGIEPDTAKKFRLGYAPDKWDELIKYLRQKNISLSLIEKSGLISARDSGTGFYDRFRDRVIFPIFDIKSRVIGFGARATKEILPKYINSPETPIYSKGKNLFGFNFTKDVIRNKDSVVIVEGYMDFIVPFQEGLDNIVASSGTALTVEQIRILKRYTHNAIVVFDADQAGELAALRSLDLFLSSEMNVKVVSLPKGSDPDSFVRESGFDELKEKIDNALNLFDFKLNLLKTKYDINKSEDKAKIAKEMLQTIKKVKNEVLKSSYLKRLAEILSVREEALFIELDKVKDDSFVLDYNRFSTKQSLNVKAVEKMIVKLLLEEEELVKQTKERLEVADFQDPHVKKIIRSMLDLNSKGKKVEVSRLMSYFDDQEAICHTLTQLSLTEECRKINIQKAFDDCLNRLKQENLKGKRIKLRNEIKTAEKLRDRERLDELLKEYNCLIKE